MGNFSTSQDSLPFSYTFYISHFTLSILHLTAQVENSLRLCGEQLRKTSLFKSKKGGGEIFQRWRRVNIKI
ncbi:MAG: hypothetical protein AB1422_05560 [bacterium]